MHRIRFFCFRYLVTLVAVLTSVLSTSGAAIAVPGTVPASGFSAWFDLDGVSNNYIPGPDLESCSEGGQDVGWINASEWLEYDIAASESAIMDVVARVASQTAAPTMDLYLDGNKVANCTTTSSGGWQTWKDAVFSAPITLNQGQAAKLRVVFTGSGFNLQKLTLIKTGTPSILSLDTSSVALPAAAATRTVQLVSNISWIATSDASWLTVSPGSGTTNAALTLAAVANTGVQRNATVVVRGAGLTRSIAVSQAAQPNTLPTITQVPNQTIIANTSTGPLAFTIGDAETPAAALTLTATSDAPLLVPLSNIVFGGNGSSRTIAVAPAANQTGTATIGVQVNDTNGGSATIQFTVTVHGGSASSILDRNGDGISDVWAALYPKIGAPGDSFLGDGITNMQKALAGLDPRDPASKFAAAVSKDIAGNLVIFWRSVAGKHYYLETSADLQQWSVLPKEFVGNGAVLSDIVRPAGATSPSRAYWHVVVFDVDSDGSGLNDWEKTHPEVVATVSASSGSGGTISPPGKQYSAQYGSLSFSITPNTGYNVDQVVVDGVNVGAVTGYNFTNLQGAHTIAATFKPLATLGISPFNISLPVTASTASVAVTSNAAWSALSNQPWLTVAPASGSGDGTLTLTASANTGAARTATVSVQAGAVIKQSEVFQAGVPLWRLRNRWKNTYMYDGGDQVKYGASAVDATYKWIIEDVGNGIKELRNVGTGDYVHIQDQKAWAQCTPRTSGWMSSRWSIEDTGDGYVRVRNMWQSTYLNVENQSGYVEVGPGCSNCLSQQWLLERADYGEYFPKKAYVPEALPTYGASRSLLPNPILDGNSDWINMYWRCWEIAFRGLRQPAAGSPLVSNWLDEAFAPNIFQWDTCFMLMFARYGHQVFPAIKSFDNFYARQLPSGYICREIQESDGVFVHYDENGGLFSPIGWKNTINPPLFSWAEVESFRLTGDKTRFSAILPVLEKYAEWLDRPGDPNASDWESNGRKSVGTTHQLYWNTPLGSGMDNTPRPADTGAGWVEMSAQMVIMYNHLAIIAEELGQSAKAEAFRSQAAAIGQRLNRWCWNEADGFYYDVLANGQQFRKKTIGGFWPMFAGIASPAQAAKLVDHLKNTSQFWRLNVFPTLSADEPEYSADGGYWRGGVWAPTNVMVIKGLVQYGYEDFAAEATEKYLRGMTEVFRTTNTVYENYAPESFAPGNPARPDFVGWTGCGPIQLLFEEVMGLRPDGIRNALTWRLRRADRHGVERMQLGSNSISLVCSARSSATAPASITVQCQKAFQLTVIHPTLGTKIFSCPAGTSTVNIQ
jgi:hypothetical protein